MTLTASLRDERDAEPERLARRSGTVERGKPMNRSHELAFRLDDEHATVLGQETVRRVGAFERVRRLETEELERIAPVGVTGAKSIEITRHYGPQLHRRHIQDLMLRTTGAGDVSIERERHLLVCAGARFGAAEERHLLVCAGARFGAAEERHLLVST